MNTDLIKKYAAAVAKHREAKKRADSFGKEVEALEGAVQNEFIDAEVDSLPVTLDNGRKMTVYLQRMVYAKPKEGTERSEVVAALKTARLSDLISYNANQLSSWVRERLGVEKKPLPKALEAVLQIEERVSVGAALSGERESKSAAVKKAMA